MKKACRLVVAMLVVLSLGLVFTGCSCSSSGSSSSNSSSNSSNSSSSGSSSKDIVGSWEYQSGGYTYTFNADGTGSYDISGTKKDFTYTDDGKELSITFTGDTAPMKLPYTISGDTLTVKDALDKDVVYKKK